ncbi:MAG: hypothetical protein NT096_03520 [Proteobacteria bacterium]|nr:hypothetical protein [Pseudomonadota bacterium]
MKNKNRPLTYYRTMEEIRAYQKVPAHEKLMWLEQANIFLYRAMSKKAKRIREKFRKGEI